MSVWIFHGMTLAISTIFWQVSMDNLSLGHRHVNFFNRELDTDDLFTTCLTDLTKCFCACRQKNVLSFSQTFSKFLNTSSENWISFNGSKCSVLKKAASISDLQTLPNSFITN